MLTSLASPQAAAQWLRVGVRGRLRSDSRQVGAGDGFIAWPGHATDGRRFVGDALAAGAARCLVEAEGVQSYGFDDPRIGTLASLKAATGEVASLFHGEPSRALRLVATTGTNGKTSTAWWMAQALGALGRRCGVVGTLGIGEPPPGGAPLPEALAQWPGASASGGRARPEAGAATGTPVQPAGLEPGDPVPPRGLAPTGLTTPDPVVLQAALRGMADAGFAACAIEASSIGLEEHRLAGTRLDVALFTNFSRDHLDYHGSMDAYWAAKRRLFDCPGLAAAVVNIDDAQGAALAGELAGRPLDLWTYAVAASAGAAVRLRAEDVRYADGGLTFTVREGNARQPVRSRLIGDYNVANLLAVIGGLRALSIPLADAVAAVPGLTAVPGRLQRVAAAFGGRSNGGSGAEAVAPAARAAAQPEVVVDYAHTPDALEQVLRSLRPLAAARGGRLVCVFGCGGNRDASKRPLMGAIAERLADAVVLTSDNPRFEAPAVILAQIAAGLSAPSRAAVVEDRREAIAGAIAGAAAADLVLIAGKGHEDYQETAGTRQPFSDIAEAAQALSRRSRAP